MAIISRRRVILSAPVVLGGASIVSACSQRSGSEGYEAASARLWQAGPTAGVEGAALVSELIRCATLAPSSHNTQCWKFVVGEKSITILPDLSRRCPAVDPDDHHVFISLGCATENLIQAARAHGLMAEPSFDSARDVIHLRLTHSTAQASPLFDAIPLRQCTRGDFDGKPLSTRELDLLERAGTSNNVRMLLLTEHVAMERVLDFVVQGNTTQMADPAFVRELKSWIRFNGGDAVRTGDGLFSVASGNPAIPTWLGEVAFGWFYTPKVENEKYVRQIRNSAGIAVFVGQIADKPNWVDVGRCYERFALQATALGIRNAFLNQPVEVPSVRSPFATAIGLTGQRPDLVVRFGRGSTLPRSLRRGVPTVLV